MSQAKLNRSLLAASIAVAALTGCAALGIVSAKPDAICMVSPLSDGNARGQVSFTQEADDVLVVVDLVNLSPGKHGIHIHQNGDCGGTAGEAAGPHFNPGGKPHGMPGTEMSHEGDLGNVIADARGHAHMELRDRLLTLAGGNGILGRSVVVHFQADDEVSQPAGNSGARIACGVITAVLR
ncbi:MAG TPA: superoxide dismutase family protein [bacterium]|jgi:Cu-Zn family superoxide dismutase|nr:superoxide dismutase family protein [bacterium]